MTFDTSPVENTYLHFIFIIIAVLAVSGNSLSFDFVWDDRPLLLGIDTYREFNLKAMLLSPANGLEYLPVRDVSYGIDYFFWDDNPAGFHFTNILLYLLNALGVYLVTREFTPLLLNGGPGEIKKIAGMTALFTALLFAVHPVHSEVVSFVTCRNVLLSGLFFFLSCYLFLRYLEHEPDGGMSIMKYYVPCLVCFVLALFSKATAIILPLILLLFVIIRHGIRHKTALSLIPFFAASGGAYFLFKKIAAGTHIMFSDQAMVPGAFSIFSRLSVSLQIPFFYLMKFLLPTDLSAEYSVEFSRYMGDASVMASTLGVIVILCAGVMLRRRRPEILYSFLWFMAALLPVMNFFLTHPVVADRYAYLSSYAFFFLLTLLVLRTFLDRQRKMMVLFFAGIIVVWSFLSIERNMVWADEKSLWENTMRVSPESFKSYENLGVIYFNEKNYGRAFELFGRLRELDPSSTAYDYHRGLQLFNMGDLPGTIDLLSSALAKDPDDLSMNDLLARSYEMSGDHEKAIEGYMNVTGSGELDAAGLRGHADERLKVLRGLFSTELNGMRSMVEKRPSDLNARVKLALALDRAGLYDEAAVHYQELEKRGGGNWMLHYNMANVYKKTARYKEAVEYYMKSIELNRKNARALNNLGLVYKKLRQYKQAERAFLDAVEADGDYAYAPFNLAVLYFHLGDAENALTYFNYVRDRFVNLKDQVYPYIRKLEKD